MSHRGKAVTCPSTPKRDAASGQVSSEVSSAVAVTPYSDSLLRRVRTLMPRSFAAWVRFWLVFSNAAKIWRFSTSARERISPSAPFGDGAGAGLEGAAAAEPVAVVVETAVAVFETGGAAEKVRAVKPRWSGSSWPPSPQ